MNVELDDGRTIDTSDLKGVKLDSRVTQMIAYDGIPLMDSRRLKWLEPNTDYVLCDDYLAYGIISISGKQEKHTDTSHILEKDSRHRIWPKARSLYVYETDFEPFTTQKPIVVFESDNENLVDFRIIKTSANVPSTRTIQNDAILDSLTNEVFPAKIHVIGGLE